MSSSAQAQKAMRYCLNKPLKFVKQYETGPLICILTLNPIFYVIHLFENWEVYEQRCWICKDPTLGMCGCSKDEKRAITTGLIK